MGNRVRARCRTYAVFLATLTDVYMIVVLCFDLLTPAVFEEVDFSGLATTTRNFDNELDHYIPVTQEYLHIAITCVSF